MHMLESKAHLHHPVEDGVFWQLLVLALCHEAKQVPLGAQLHHDAHLVALGEGVVAAHYVGVLEGHEQLRGRAGAGTACMRHREVGACV